jgi:hypothetical protein
MSQWGNYPLTDEYKQSVINRNIMSDRLQSAIRSASVNGVIKLQDALNIAQQFDTQEGTTIDLLKAFQRETGLHWGEQVDKHLSSLTGKFFNEKAYDVADKNGEQ